MCYEHDRIYVFSPSPSEKFFVVCLSIPNMYMYIIKQRSYVDGTEEGAYAQHNRQTLSSYVIIDVLLWIYRYSIATYIASSFCR